MGPNPEYADDPTVGDQDVVWRRVPAESCDRRADGSIVVGSWAFSDSNDGTPMSVDLASIAADPTATAAGFAGCIVVGLRVGDLRAEGFGVMPWKDGDNDAHAYVLGSKNKQTKRRRLKKLAFAVWPPDLVLATD
jgi:hypothetical protein